MAGGGQGGVGGRGSLDGRGRGVPGFGGGLTPGSISRFGGGPQGIAQSAGGVGPSPDFQPPSMDGGPSIEGGGGFPVPQPPLPAPPISPNSGAPKPMPPTPAPGGMGGINGMGVDAGFGTGPLVNGMQQEIGVPPAPQPSMPAGIPPAQPQLSKDQKTGMAPVSGKPASTGMSSAADAQKKMMARAGVKPLPNPGAQQGKKPAPISMTPPKPTQ